MNIGNVLLLVVLGLLGLTSTLHAQRDYDIYWVQFKDKGDTPYSVFRPQEFLSPRAVERRQRFGILVDSTDLPINPRYLEPIRIKGFQIHSHSRWLNGVAIIAQSSSNSPMDLEQFEFVEKVFPIGFKRDPHPVATEVGERDYTRNYRQKQDYYGLGKNQIQMLNGHYLHKMGYNGREMHVAVLDGGFDSARETPAFDSLFQSGRLLGTYDFVEEDEYVYEASSHGRNVLSCMAAEMPNLLVGTAPKASYYLFKTEDVKGEYLIEEYNWIAAAERADSLGVDVINSSLGYYDFDDNDMDYAYKDINGSTAAMTQAASLASKKGIMVVTSAGNEGNGKWKHITVPGDAPNVLTIGSVDRNGFHSRFSSYGFAERDYLKPNVVARGSAAIVATRKRYDTSYSNGTSFSSPILAGAITSFWQAFPNYSNEEIMEVVQQSADKVDTPDTAYGYGLPDFFKAYKTLSNSVVELNDTDSYYYPAADLTERLDVFMSDLKVHIVTVSLHNAQEQLLFETTYEEEHPTRPQLFYETVPGWSDLPNGVYYLTLQLDDQIKRILLTK